MSENGKRMNRNWRNAFLHGSFGAISGFLAGTAVDGLLLLAAKPPVYAGSLGMVFAMFGLAFGFGEGLTD